VHIPNEKRIKLDSKYNKYIFVSYSDKTKAHKLYNEETRDIIISKYIIFDESQEYETIKIQENNKGKEKVIEEEIINIRIIVISSINDDLEYELSTNVIP